MKNRSEVCSISQLNMNNLNSNLLWIYAYYGQSGSLAWKNLLNYTNISEVNMILKFI